MKINFDIQIKNFKGEVITGKNPNISPVPELVANMLLNAGFTQSSDIKKNDLATKIYKEKNIEIDASDFRLVMDAVNFRGQQDMVGPAIRAPLLVALEDQEKKAKK